MLADMEPTGAYHLIIESAYLWLEDVCSIQLMLTDMQYPA